MTFLKAYIDKFHLVKTKRIAIVSILLIIIISYGLFFYLQNKTENDIKNSLFEKQKQRQIESTKALSQHIGSDLSSIMTRLELLANSPVLMQGDLSSNETRKLLQEVYHKLNTIATVDRLFILDKNNIATMSMIPAGEKQTFVGVDFSYRPWVKQTKTTLMPVFSDGFLGRDGKYRIALTYPITNGSSGEYVGIVEALVPTIQFFQSYGNIYDIKAQYLAVLDRNSVQLIHPVKSFIGKSFFGSYTQEVTGHNKVLNNVIHTVMSGQPDFAVYDFRNGERLNTGYPISVDGKLLYFIFVITPTSTIYSQIDNVVLTERIEMFSLLAGVTAAIVVLILFLLKWSSNLENEVKSRTKELYQANEQLRTHDKMQREFINVAAHELRTPIQAMLGLADLLKTKINDKEQHQLAEVISRNAKRLKRLSQEALDVTRIEGGSLTLSTERIDLNDLIAHVVGDYRQQIQESGNNNARLIFDSNKGSVFVKADKERIAQVFSNLLRNAVTFTKDGKDQTILVRLEERTREENHYENKNQVKREVVVSVRDSGKGIDQNVIPRLFTKFATTSFQGTGLALFISRSIIEAHGGKIWAENNKDAEGATFYFSLPQ